MADAAARTARRLLWMIPALVVLGLVAFRLVLDSETTSRVLAGWVAATLADRSRSSVQLSGVRFDWGLAPCFEDFVLYRYHGPLRVKVATPRACVKEWASALGSRLHAVRIELQQPTIEIAGGDDGAAAVPSRARPDAKAEGPELLREVVLAFDSLRFEWAGLPLPDRLASGSFGPFDGEFILQTRGAAAAAVVSITEPSSGTEVSGRIAPSTDAWDLSAGIEGDVIQLLGDALSVQQVKLRRMPTKGTVGAQWFPKEERLKVAMDLEQYDVDFESPLVARNRLVGFSAREKAILHFDLAKRHFEVESGLIDINGIPIEVDLELAPKEGAATFEMQLRLRTIQLGRLLTSIPASEAPELARAMSPDVRFAAELRMTGVSTRPDSWTPELNYRFEGLDPGPTGLERYEKPFEYYPLGRDGRSEEPLKMGPGTPHWQSYSRLPYLLRRAIIVAEDSTFPFHNGLELEEMKAALKSSFARGTRTRGGSTITQQLAKNLFLTRDRTALRKAQEMVLTFLLEASLEKRRIFELYVNLIEWGPGVHGITAAAQHYFGRTPQSLSIRQMAYLATIIPSPTRFHRHHRLGRVPPSHRMKVDALLDRLNRLGQLDEDAWTQAKADVVRFSPHVDPTNPPSAP